MPPAVALLNYISCDILWRIFRQTGIFAGFSLQIIFIVRRISAAAISGNIILFSLGGLVGDYSGAYIVIFRGIFSIFSRRNSEAALGGAGVGAGAGDIIFLGAE